MGPDRTIEMSQLRVAKSSVGRRRDSRVIAGHLPKVYDYFLPDFNTHQISADFQRSGICLSGERN
jgi:hypothetical protein